MAAETQPRFMCGQPSHPAARGGTESWQGPPHAPPPQGSQGGGLPSLPGWGRTLEGWAAQPEEPGLGFRPHSLSCELSDLGHTPKCSVPQFSRL